MTSSNGNTFRVEANDTGHFCHPWWSFFFNHGVFRVFNGQLLSNHTPFVAWCYFPRAFSEYCMSPHVSFVTLYIPVTITHFTTLLSLGIWRTRYVNGKNMTSFHLNHHWQKNNFAAYPVKYYWYIGDDLIAWIHFYLRVPESSKFPFKNAFNHSYFAYLWFWMCVFNIWGVCFCKSFSLPIRCFRGFLISCKFISNGDNSKTNNTWRVMICTISIEYVGRFNRLCPSGTWRCFS